MNLLECIPEVLRFGKIENGTNIDLFVFSHPFYFIAHEDEAIGHMYKQYEQAFIVFEINNN